jgi:hypothetical protein
MADEDGSDSIDQRGEKVSVTQQPGASSEAFAARAMALLFETQSHWALNTVLASTPDDWLRVNGERWLEAWNRTDSKLCLRVTMLKPHDGGVVGHLVIDLDGDPIADDWGKLEGGTVILPRTATGFITTGWAFLWRLVHVLRGLDSEYDAVFECSGIMVG